MNGQHRPFFHWFAGFFDGEGTFVIRRHRNDTSYTAAVAISLRDDDLPILVRIKYVLGMGTIYRYESKLGNSKPRATWQVAKIDDLVRLVNIFDSHPLRSKKSKDYTIWRNAILEIKRGSRSGGRNRATYNRPYLEYLRTKLNAGRKYKMSEPQRFELIPIKDVNNESSFIRLPSLEP